MIRIASIPLFSIQATTSFQLFRNETDRRHDRPIYWRHSCHLVFRSSEPARGFFLGSVATSGPPCHEIVKISLPGRSDSPWPSKVRDATRAPVCSAAPGRRSAPRRSFSYRRWRAPYGGPGTRGVAATAWTSPARPCAAARSPVAAVSLQESRRTRSHRPWSASRGSDPVPTSTLWSPPATAYWCLPGTSVPVDLRKVS